MIVEAKAGLFRHRVSVDGYELPVHREGGGWHRVAGFGPIPATRVRYSGWGDRLWIESPLGPLEVHFGWFSTSFEWRGRAYAVRSLLWGRILIEEGGRTAIHGSTTWGGVRLDAITPEFVPIATGLALGLALRQAAMAAASAG